MPGSLDEPQRNDSELTDEGRMRGVVDLKRPHAKTVDRIGFQMRRMGMIRAALDVAHRNALIPETVQGNRFLKWAQSACRGTALQQDSNVADSFTRRVVTGKIERSRLAA